MRRTQIYVTDDQQRRIGEIAADRGVSKATVIRELLDQALGQSTDESDARAAIAATAGICAEYPDWPEWLRDVRGRTADERLSRMGL